MDTATKTDDAVRSEWEDILNKAFWSKEVEYSFTFSQIEWNPPNSAGLTESLDPIASFKSLSGWRFGIVSFSMLLGFFLAIVETTITATALVTIGEYFDDSFKVAWVILSYLISYMGFSVIFARLSDGIGRKDATIFAWILFSGFSLASGLAQSLDQLIVFRALQGIGGSGLFSMTMIVLPEVSPVNFRGLISGLIGICVACSSVVGPILGGVITQESTWRWIYLFNAPLAVIGVVSFLVAWPRSQEPKAKSKGPWTLFSQMDILGALLLLLASALLVFALQEAGGREYDWNSPAIVISFAVSGFCWCAFIIWISWLNSNQSRVQIKPIFPLSVTLNRPIGPAILLSLLTGFTFFITIVNLPLQFQVVNGDTPIMAGVHMLPLLVALALGSTIGGIVSAKKNLTSYCLIVATCLMSLGCGLLSTTSSSRKIISSQYCYQFILGLGIGLSLSSLTFVVIHSSSNDTIASVQGAIGQARVLGGNIGLAGATIIFTQQIAANLVEFLTASQLDSLRQSLSIISNLDDYQQAAVAVVFSNCFNGEMRVCACVSAISVIVALFTWKRNPSSVT